MDIRGVLLDSSVLDESASLEKLLVRLGYSNLHVVRTPSRVPSLALPLGSRDVVQFSLEMSSVLLRCSV